jgi:putative salt-induced outer membrane protein YdiY
MQYLRFAAALAALATITLAQDKITLANGDVLTGSIKTMADGKITIASALLGDVTVPMTTVSNLVTQSQVDLETKGGELMRRRIVGIDGGNLRLEGDSASLALDRLGRINPPSKTEPVWTGSVKVSGLWTDGNTDTRSIGASFDASRRTEIDRTSIDASWDYAENKDNEPTSATFRQWSLDQRRAGGGAKYDYFLSKDLYALANARVLADTLADIELRFTGGAGLGYSWVDDGTTTFLTEVGLSYVDETFRSAAPSQEYVAARVAYKLSHAFSDKTKLVHGVEAFPSVEEQDDIYLQAKTELVTSLTESMVASIAHVLDYDNTPSTTPTRTFERLDNRIVLSIGWSF